MIMAYFRVSENGNGQELHEGVRQESRCLILGSGISHLANMGFCEIRGIFEYVRFIDGLGKASLRPIISIPKWQLHSQPRDLNHYRRLGRKIGCRWRGRIDRRPGDGVCRLCRNIGGLWRIPAVWLLIALPIIVIIVVVRKRHGMRQQQ